MKRMYPCSLIATVFLLSGYGFAQNVVYPTGNPADDVANVQAAVDLGGTVLLKAVDQSGAPRAFNFGELPLGWLNWNAAGWVALGTAGQMIPDPDYPQYFYYSLGNDVQIVGEKIKTKQSGKSAPAMTTIKGGNVPVRNWGPRNIPGVGIRYVYGLGHFAISGVRFKDSTYGTVNLFDDPTPFADGRNLDIGISGCEFVDIKPGLVYQTVSGSRVPLFWYQWGPLVMSPRGFVRMSDNRLSLTPGKWATAMQSFESQVGPSYGLISFGPRIDSLAGPAEISGNQVLGFGLGISLYYGMAGGQARITRNQVTAENYGMLCAGANRCFIEDNKISAIGNMMDGVWVGAYYPGEIMEGSSVARNEFEMGLSEAGGVTVLGGGRRNRVGQNTFKGGAAYALGILANANAPEALAEENVFNNNNISQFVPRDSQWYGTGVDVLFDSIAHYNLLHGDAGTVLDLGVGNVIVGKPVLGARPRLNSEKLRRLRVEKNAMREPVPVQ